MGKNFFFTLFFFAFVLANPTKAFAISCNAAVSPSSLNTNVSDNLYFTVENTDEVGTSLYYLKFIVPSNNFTITSINGPYIIGAALNELGTEDAVTLSGLGATEIKEYSLGVSTGSHAAAAASWVVQASESESGENSVNCGGNTGVSIISAGQAILNISNVAVSITSTTASITWNTSVDATGKVDYGVTDQYGGTTSESGSSTSHSVSLTGLTSNTIYHYQVSSSDASSNVAQLVDNSFRTALAGVTVVTTTTVTASTTTTTSAKKDTASPSVLITTDLSKPFEQSPEINGKASDSSRIVKVDYSTDGGVNWLPVDEVDNLGSKTVNFSFTPNIFDDGNYSIMVRAIDGAENTGRSKSHTLVIDRLPPLVGGNIWSIGPIPLLPDANGVITALSGVEHRITMSAVGGPISIDLIVGGKTYPMIKSVGSGLWSGVVNFGSPGHYIVKVKSVDGAKNETLRDLNSIQVIGSGRVTEKEGDKSVTGAKINIYQQDELSKLWSLWDASSFGQKIAQVTDEEGRYSYFLPAGTYYLTVTASGYKKLTSKIFRLDSATALNTGFEMTKGWFFNPFDVVNISVTTPRIDATGENKDSLVGTEASGFLLPTINGSDLNLVSLRGKSRLIIFLNTWLPDSAEQISQVVGLEEKYKDRVSLVVLQENLSKISVFAKKGGYEGFMIAADSDGTLVTPYKINSLPTGYFIDRKGIVQKVLTGVIPASDIINYIDSI